MIATARGVAVGLLLLLAGAAQAEDDLFKPEVPVVTDKPAPPPTKPTVKPSQSPLVGTWRLVVKGGMFCATDTTATFTATASGGVRGYADFEMSPGDFSRVEVKGDAVRLVFDWVDLLGDPAVSIYSGTFSADGNSVSGDASGEWDDGCTFKMTRR